MQLKPLETHSLFDADASRDRLHFAVSRGVSHLYTLQADDVLCAWSLSKTLIPATGGRATLPFDLYEPAHQFSGERLLLWADGQVVVFGVANPSQPKVEGSLELDGVRTCAAIGDSLYLERYLGDDEGYAVCAMPTGVGATPTVTKLLPSHDAHGSYAAVLGERVLWATQASLELMRCSPPAFEGRLRYDSVVAYPLVISPTRLAVLETYDDGRTAVSFVDLEGKKLKKIASFHPKELVRAWCLSGDRLTVVLRSSKRLSGKREFATSLVVFDVNTAAELVSLPLPFVEVYGEDETRVVWLGVVDDLCAVLLGTGELHRFTVKP